MTIRQRIASASHAAGRAVDKFTPWARDIERAEAYQAAYDRLRAEIASRPREPDAPARHPDGCDLGMIDDLGQCPHLPPARESAEQGLEPDDAIPRTDRYGWQEAEATKPDAYRTAQLDQADHGAEPG